MQSLRILENIVAHPFILEYCNSENLCAVVHAVQKSIQYFNLQLSTSISYYALPEG